MMRTRQNVRGRYEQHLHGNLLTVEESNHDVDRVVLHAGEPQAGKTSTLTILIHMLRVTVTCQ